jgi:hypothetical protein
MAGPDRTAFETPDSAYAVLDFYEKALLDKGWALYQRWGPNSAEYEWQDSKLMMPYSIHAVISAGGEAPAGEGPSVIHITVGPQPDPNNIPIYPDAQQVEKKDVLVTQVISQEPIKDEERRVTFATNAEPAQVEAYYKDKLPQYGWTLGEGPGPYFSEGITFTFRRSAGVTFLTGSVVNYSSQEGGKGADERTVAYNGYQPEP